MTKIIRREFNYVDAMPGAGKTEYFVNEAIALLQERKPRSILIYAAPTLRLLHEALARLQRSPEFKKHMLTKVTLVVDPLKAKPNGCRSFTERPVKVATHLLGLGDCGLTLGDEVAPELANGSIMMTTHETFVQIPNKDKTGNDFCILRKTKVIFDEARQCVLETKTARDLSSYDLALMAKGLFDFDRCHMGKETSPWFIYELSEAPSDLDLSVAFKTHRLRTISPTIRKLQREVSTFADNGRASVYLMTSDDLDDHDKLSKTISQVDRAFKKKGKLNLESLTNVMVTTMLRPTSLFNYYQEVTLTSAFFKDSQMFHFLRQDGHTFHNLMKKPSGSLIQVAARDARLRKMLPRRLMVAPLIKSPTREGPKKNLTAGLLEHGMLVPSRINSASAEETMNKNYTLSQMIDNLRRGNTVSSSPAVQETLRRFCVPPLWVLIRECARILNKVHESGLLPKNESCLLVFNVKARLWFEVPATAVIRELYSWGSLRASGGSCIQQEGAVDKEVLANSCPREWETRLAKHLYMEAEESLFTVAPSTKLHGLNKYSGLNAFAHLAALNPDPLMATLYKTLLGPKYDIDLDHSIENLVQTLYRTSLRRTDCKDRVLMIVPYASQAAALQKKIGCDEFLSVHAPRLVRWGYRKPVDSEVAKKNGSKGGRRSAEVRSLGLDEGQKKRYRSLSAQIRAYQKQIRDAPADIRRKHWESRINLLTKEKAEMVEAAKRIKDFKN